MIIRFLLIVIGLICQINLVVPQLYPSSHQLFLGEQKVTNHLFKEAHQNPDHKRFGRVLNNKDLQCPMENTHCVDNHVISYDFIPSWKDCGQLCYLEKACKFWTFRLSTNVCFLKYACEKPISGISSSISGYHTCVEGKLSIEEDCKEQELFNKEQLEQLKSEKETIETKLQQLIEELKACKEDQTKVIERPECLDYNILNEADRANTGEDQSKVNCDGMDAQQWGTAIKSPNWVGPAWYRFEEPAGLKMAENPPGMWHCGTDGPGWISEPHPKSVGESKDVEFCFHWNSDCLYSESGKVTNCGSYYVYFLVDAPYCTQRYCAG